MNIAINRSRIDLTDKKPGAVVDDGYPKIIWTRMLRRPTSIPMVGRGRALVLHGCFNSILEERLVEEGGNLQLISIEVQDNEFDMTGHLTTSGMNTFWKEMDRGLKHFDCDEIKLLPRIPSKQQSKNDRDRSQPRAHNAQRHHTPPSSSHHHRQS